MALKVIIVPGNGCTNIRRGNWYGWLATTLELQYPALKVVCETFPDPYEAKESIWLPFLKETLADENTILIGHSSGAEAIMRYLETNRVLGAILVSACWTDLGEPSETISGYYSRPWQWGQISANARWIVQFGSTDDPFIPISEMRHVAEKIGTEYIEFADRGHFMDRTMPEIVTKLEEKLKGTLVSK